MIAVLQLTIEPYIHPAEMQCNTAAVHARSCEVLVRHCNVPDDDALRSLELQHSVARYCNTKVLGIATLIILTKGNRAGFWAGSWNNAAILRLTIALNGLVMMT